jgi:hypothetical protein
MIDPHSSPPQTPAPFVGPGPQIYGFAAALALLMGLPLLYLYLIAPEQAPVWGNIVGRRTLFLSRYDLQPTIFTLLLGLILTCIGINGLYQMWQHRQPSRR